MRATGETWDAVGAELFRCNTEDHADDDRHDDGDEDERKRVDHAHQNDDEEANDRPCDGHIKRLTTQRLLAAGIVLRCGERAFENRVAIFAQWEALRLSSFSSG